MVLSFCSVCFYVKSSTDFLKDIRGGNGGIILNMSLIIVKHLIQHIRVLQAYLHSKVKQTWIHAVIIIQGGVYTPVLNKLHAPFYLIGVR
ncbi:hypothetical protein GDO86_012715 [Hymenochirus boettgeri]|uniref:Uncharacterized protein n=1 Tax=Hymenochirus boettgeri TaxID=247094 RepID=A0A8T2IS70_9PIPI|nr:hypothetical protein GDO86_012715 [Hymenochirus boettgeri]